MKRSVCSIMCPTVTNTSMCIGGGVYGSMYGS